MAVRPVLQYCNRLVGGVLGWEREWLREGQEEQDPEVGRVWGLTLVGGDPRPEGSSLRPAPEAETKSGRR